VFEPRIAAVVSSCGFDSFQDYKGGEIAGWTSPRYMPRLLDYPLADIPFDFHDVIGAVAPRPCLVSAPLGDANFIWQSVDRIVAAASRVYDLYGSRGNLMVEHSDCGHDFPPEVRERAYMLFERCLGRDKQDGERRRREDGAGV
jgi:hypothetical protein